jgi:hypothetical protein
MVSNCPSYLIHALRNAPKIQLHTQAEPLYKIAITKATRWNLRSVSYQAGFNPEPIIDGMPDAACSPGNAYVLQHICIIGLNR